MERGAKISPSGARKAMKISGRVSDSKTRVEFGNRPGNSGTIRCLFPGRGTTPGVVPNGAQTRHVDGGGGGWLGDDAGKLRTAKIELIFLICNLRGIAVEWFTSRIRQKFVMRFFQVRDGYKWNMVLIQLILCCSSLQNMQKDPTKSIHQIFFHCFGIGWKQVRRSRFCFERGHIFDISFNIYHQPLMRACHNHEIQHVKTHKIISLVTPHFLNSRQQLTSEKPHENWLLKETLKSIVNLLIAQN